ncbi:hypothetical protein EAI30_04920 [Romboutsia ilealis]|uniref:Uncharacterized protein n=1 Tax=Romboutsia faecis TaxID=2764597 RepID=A0ABR7JLE8_9FIRM|nr:hypothetical protein [Romboutsia faecis]MBC5995756.1 hypothetical protein [Romboutsia faecis]MRN23957.1 hypothetical protein [Romboutsia ilealis]
MKYIGLVLSSVCIFIIVLANLYYNSITLDMQRMKNYIVECNRILSDTIEKEELVNEKKDEYISRLISLKKGIKNSKTSFLVKDYKDYKVKSIDNLIYMISYPNDKEIYLSEVEKYNKLSEEELNKLINKDFMEVTYLSAKTYI